MDIVSTAEGCDGTKTPDGALYGHIEQNREPKIGITLAQEKNMKLIWALWMNSLPNISHITSIGT
jgi:hypothetical protein